MFVTMRKVPFLMLAFAPIFLFISCKNVIKEVTPTLFQLIDSTSINFTNTVEDGRVEKSFLFRNFYNGGGVAASDVNGDGKIDLVLGNIGNNFYLYPNEKNTVKLWINDFDQNGILDKVMTHAVNPKDMTVFLKHELGAQLPVLKKQNLLHKVFSKKSIQVLFPDKIISACVLKQFNYTNSVVAINQGNGQFEIKTLPIQTQWSCINAMQVVDANNDGFKDIVFGGNDFDLVPQFGRLDASLGGVLLNNGMGYFTYADANKSGISDRGEIKDIKQITINKKQHILILQNNELPVLYKLSNSK
jgi:hypothetical protein